MNPPRYEIVEESDTCVVIRDVGPWHRHATITNGARIIVHRHSCPRCGTRWTHRIPSGTCGAYDGEPLRCGLCAVRDQYGEGA